MMVKGIFYLKVDRCPRLGYTLHCSVNKDLWTPCEGTLRANQDGSVFFNAVACFEDLLLNNGRDVVWM